LLHEAELFRSCPHACSDSQWTDSLLHDKLAQKGEEDGIESDKGEVVATFAILACTSDWIREKYGMVERIRGCRIKCIGTEDG